MVLQSPGCCHQQASSVEQEEGWQRSLASQHFLIGDPSSPCAPDTRHTSAGSSAPSKGHMASSAINNTIEQALVQRNIFSWIVMRTPTLRWYFFCKDCRTRPVYTPHIHQANNRPSPTRKADFGSKPCKIAAAAATAMPPSTKMAWQRHALFQGTSSLKLSKLRPNRTHGQNSPAKPVKVNNDTVFLVTQTADYVYCCKQLEQESRYTNSQSKSKDVCTWSSQGYGRPLNWHICRIKL